MNNRDEKGQFTEGNTASVGAALGAEGALRKLEKGQALVGLAHDAEVQVTAELEVDGRAVIVRRAAVRLESVARLFYNAILAAVERQDFDKLAQYAQRYAWLQARALAAWEQLKREQRDDDGSGTEVQAILERYQKAAMTDDKPDS